MSKRAIASAVAYRHGLPQADAAKVVDTVTDLIGVILNQQGRVVLHGFGSFVVTSKARRQARAPRPGAQVSESPVTVTFEPSPALRARVAATPLRK